MRPFAGREHSVFEQVVVPVGSVQRDEAEQFEGVWLTRVSVEDAKSEQIIGISAPPADGRTALDHGVAAVVVDVPVTPLQIA